MDRLAYVVLPLAGGALIAAQAPMNARLRGVVASPVGSAFVSFLVGTVILAVVVLALGDLPGIASGIGEGPWWAYVGGACGAVFVFATLVASPRLGVTATFVAVIAGQVACAAVIDRMGLFGVPASPITVERLVAIGLLAVSVVLLVRSR